MPSHTETLKNTLESKGLKFHLTAGNAKWQCTVLDRATHERRKAERTDSSSSVESTTSTSSSSSTKSH
ncbi:hypothetical protein NEMBOFW57_007349 [Staphylotrichum longicolle]|uniref:Uncharacterized protein n=1 Tax=Staphylotrichum longicolle TaxID=669026 RepID=A0AAD4EUN2_9PEZI|nr:hypothetical protein NEMBOFW57_007349 [Staphylotrichum longicolle]